MPITIYRDNIPEDQEIAWLCDGNWNFSSQVETLTMWLENTGSDLPVGSYVVLAFAGDETQVVAAQHFLRKP